MGVDYYQCAKCTVGFRDDNEYCAWCECGNCFCSVKCGKLENYAEEYVEHESDENKDVHIGDRVDPNKPTTCVICRNEAYTDHTLLEAVMKHFNLTKDQVVNIWRKQKKK
jgi:hypothetical protein